MSAIKETKFVYKYVVKRILKVDVWHDSLGTDIHEPESNNAATWTVLNFTGIYINLVVFESSMFGESSDELIASLEVGTSVAILG
jgi:hypothetical protein